MVTRVPFLCLSKQVASLTHRSCPYAHSFREVLEKMVARCERLEEEKEAKVICLLLQSFSPLTFGVVAPECHLGLCSPGTGHTSILAEPHICYEI